MLDDQTREKITARLDHYPTKRAACVEAMKIVQKSHRWVSDEHLADVAEILEMTPDELDAVATFYNLIFRRPVGEHVILLCESVSCFIVGYDDIREKLMERLEIDYGETTDDDRFTLLPICCLGDCDRAPVMMVDEDTFDELTPEKVDAIVDAFEEGDEDAVASLRRDAIDSS